MSQSPESSYQRICSNCKAPAADAESVCARCGMPITEDRRQKFIGNRISFPMYMVLLTLFCLFMMFWLPR